MSMLPVGPFDRGIPPGFMGRAFLAIVCGVFGFLRLIGFADAPFRVVSHMLFGALASYAILARSRTATGLAIALSLVEFYVLIFKG
jgi:hypothetical protein